MKKIFSLIIVATLGFSGLQNTNAQTFDTDSKVVNLGIGFGYTYGYWGGASSWPALSVSFEKGFKELDNLGTLSLGGIFGFQHTSYYDLNWNDLIIAARGGLHFSAIDVDNLDVYGGASVGLRFYTEPDFNWSNGKYENKTHVGPAFGFYGGARYYFTDNIAGFGEFGYEITYAKFGVAFKF